MFTSSMGSALRTLLSRYASCPLFHMMYTQRSLSAVEGGSLPPADGACVRGGVASAALLQIFRQAEHVLLRHLRDDFLGLAVHHADDESIGLRILLETQFVFRSKHFRAVDRLDGLNHFSFLRRLIHAHRRHGRMDTVGPVDCG